MAGKQQCGVCKTLTDLPAQNCEKCSVLWCLLCASARGMKSMPHRGSIDKVAKRIRNYGTQFPKGDGSPGDFEDDVNFTCIPCQRQEQIDDVCTYRRLIVENTKITEQDLVQDGFLDTEEDGLSDYPDDRRQRSRHRRPTSRTTTTSTTTTTTATTTTPATTTTTTSSASQPRSNFFGGTNPMFGQASGFGQTPGFGTNTTPNTSNLFGSTFNPPSASSSNTSAEIMELLQKMTEAQSEITKNQSQVTQLLSQRNESTGPKGKLPEVKLPSWGGDPLQYESFKQAFKCLIQDIPDTRLPKYLKLHFLLECLHKRPKQLVESLGKSATAYDEALRLLDEQYGGESNIIRAAEDKLRNLPVCKSESELFKLEKFIDGLRAHTSVLTRAGVSEERMRGHIPAIWGKIPEQTRKELLVKLKIYDVTTELRFTPLIDFLTSHIKLLKGIKQADRPLRSEELLEHPPTMLFQSSRFRGNGRGNGKSNYSSQATVNRTPGVQRFKRPFLPCAFCTATSKPGAAEHSSRHCTQYTTFNARKTVVRENKLCYSCLRPNCSSSQCPRKRSCPAQNCHALHSFALHPPSEQFASAFPGLAARGRIGPRTTNFRGRGGAGSSSMKYRVGNRGAKQTRPNFTTLRYSRGMAPRGQSSRASRPQMMNMSHEDTNQLTQELEGFHIGPQMMQQAEPNLLVSQKSQPQVGVMACFPAKLVNPVTKDSLTVQVYADLGANSTTVSRTIADKLSLPIERTGVLSSACFGESKAKQMTADHVKFILEGSNGYRIAIDGLAVDSVCPPITVESYKWPSQLHWSKIAPRLLNPPQQEGRTVQVDVLLGIKQAAALLLSKITPISKSLFLSHSGFGVICFGAAKPATCSSKMITRAQLMMNNSTNEDLKELYSQELCGITEKNSDMTLAKEAEILFLEHFQRLESGEYSVGFPIRAGVLSLGSNYHIAKGRLESLIKQLWREGKGPKKLLQYNDAINKWIEDGTMEVVGDKPANGPIFYVSHLGVSKDSKTTPLRVCLDFAQKSKAGHCPNDFILQGSNYLPNLLSIIIKFRMSEKYVLCSDLRSAFTSLALAPVHSDLTRILWPLNVMNTENLTTLKPSEIMVLRCRKVPFGAASSPFCLHKVLEHHLQLPEYKSTLVDQLRANIFVDNMFSSTNEEEELENHYKDSKKIFADAKMELRQFSSNSKFIMNKVNKEETDKNHPFPKFLGLKWNTEQDCIQVIKPKRENKGQTKRDILRVTASLFDPLQLFSVISIKAKLAIKKAWMDGLGWDDPLNEEQVKNWQKIQTELDQLSDLEIPRRAILDTTKGVEIAVFADASFQCHAIALYCVQRNLDPNKHEGQTSCSRLLISKASVNPSKALSIVRLELLAIVKATRLLKFVIQSLPSNIKITSKRIFSDSSVAVAQIAATNRKWPIYVENRVKTIKKIREELDGFEIFHCPGEMNTSDYPTRGQMSLDDMKNSDWLSGPSWLLDPLDLQPPVLSELNARKVIDTKGISQAQMDEQAILSRNETQLLNKAEVYTEYIGPYNISLYTNNDKIWKDETVLFKETARAMKKEKGQDSTKLEPEDLREAEKEWIRFVQAEAFPDTIKNLKKNKPCKLAKQLDLAIDPEGILRIGSRLHNAPNLTHDSKYSSLLPNRHPFTEFAIMASHISCGHQRSRITLNKLRRKYWLIRGHHAVYSVIRFCTQCRRLQGAAFTQPPFAPYPRDRLSTTSLAMSWISTDIAGPVYLLRDTSSPFAKKGQKSWILVQRCLVFGAIDAELLPDYSAESVILAFRRIWSRRGTPRKIYSDNGANLVAAGNYFNAITGPSLTTREQQELQTFLLDSRVKVHRIPQYSPWAGGLHEASVKMVKTVILKAIGSDTIRRDLFRTILAESVMYINLRPITWISNTFNDAYVLTPSHFLCPNNRNNIPESQEDVEGTPKPPLKPESVVELHKKLEEYLSKIWKLFQDAVYSQLAEDRRMKFKATKGSVDRTPQIGEVVLERQKTKRLTWPLCRIRDYLPSTDGKVRYCVIELPNGHTRSRAVKDLVPLSYWPRPTVQELENSQLRQELNEDKNKDGNKTDKSEDSQNHDTEEPEEQEENERTRSVSESSSDSDESVKEPIFPPGPLTRSKAKQYNIDPMMVQLSYDHLDKCMARDGKEESPDNYNEPPTFGNIRRFKALMPVTLLALYMLVTVTNCATVYSPPPGAVPTHHTYQVCAVPFHGGRIYAIPTKPPKCDALDPKKERKHMLVDVFTPNGYVPTITAYKCYLERLTTITHTGVLGAKAILSSTRQTFAVTRQQCVNALMMIQNVKQSDDSGTDQAMFMIDQGLYSTNHTHEPTFKYCCYSRKTVTTNFILEEGELSVGKDDTLVSNLGSTAGCKIMDMKCIRDTYSIIWFRTDIEDYCAYTHRGLFTALQTGPQILIPDLQSAVTISKDTIGTIAPFVRDNCLPVSAKHTKEGLVVSLQDNPRFKELDERRQNTTLLSNGTRSRPKRERVTRRTSVGRLAFSLLQDLFSARWENGSRIKRSGSQKLDPHVFSKARKLLNIFNGINAQLEFHDLLLMEEMDNGFKHFYHTLCLANYQRYQILQNQLHISPSLAARTLLDDDSIAATLHGELLYISRCKEVDANHVFTSHKLPHDNNTCYEFTPVEVELNNKEVILFAPPGSKDLVTSSPEINCDHVKSPMVEEETIKNGKRAWKDAEGAMHVEQMYHYHQFHKPELLTYSAPPLQLSKIINPISTLQSVHTRMAELEYRLSKTINYASQLSFHPTATSKFLENTVDFGYQVGKGTYTMARAAGNGLATVVNEAGNTIANFGVALLSPILKAATIFIVIITVCLVILYVIYRYLGPKCRKAPRVTRRFFNYGKGDCDLQEQGLGLYSPNDSVWIAGSELPPSPYSTFRREPQH